MREYLLPYHQSHIRIELPEDLSVDCYDEKNMPVLSDPESSIEKTLANLEIDHFVKNNDLHSFRIAIAINDKTRPIPHQTILPPLLRWLHNNGFAPEQITFFIATGTHKVMSQEEIAKIFPGNIVHKYKLLSHNCDSHAELIHLGNTTCGTPVWINRQFFQSDFKIVVGNIEPHHFMGYSGGVKSAAIGLAGRETITHNHKMLLLPEAKAGTFEENPMRMDIEEIGRMIGIQLALNVVLNHEKKIISVIAGDPMEVMRKGIAIVKEQMMVQIEEPYDLVIASSGGYPKDINLYQAQKAMTHASYFAREGGYILLVAACSEGFGSKSFEDFIALNRSSAEITNYFKDHPFEIGPHKALQIAKITNSKNVILKSDINEQIPDYLIRTTDCIQQSINHLLATITTSPKIAVLPSATHTIPYQA